MDFAVPGDQNIAIQKHENIDKCQDYRTTESLECQGSGHTGSYRCSRNYAEESTLLYKAD